MRTLYTTLILFFALSYPLSGQDFQSNVLPNQVFDAITFNGYTIEQLRLTQGDADAVTNLLGSPTHINDGLYSIGFEYGQNGFSFRRPQQTSLGFVPGYISVVFINNHHWPMVIQGAEVRVGMSVAELEELLIGAGVVQELKRGYNIMHDNSIVRFVTILRGNEQSDTIISIRLDPDSLIITEIRYWINA